MPTLTDSGLETWLIFAKGAELPDFASYPLLDSSEGRDLLAEYFRDHLRIAARSGADLVLETPTWRANSDWGARLGYDAVELDRLNREAVRFVREIGAEFDGVRLTVSGNLGPRGDGYNPAELLTPEAAEAYHRPQIESLAAGGADRITMLTATHTGEAIGVVRAAHAVGLPVVMSFTVETDGRLPSGQALHEAIAEVDAATDGAALYFGINCAHPDHFSSVLDADTDAIRRIGLLRANASRMSHAELDEAEELDDGDPVELAGQYAALVRDHPHLTVLGGCCGTDARHVDAIASTCLA
jgi:homocysteine S-methyltransferase